MSQLQDKYYAKYLKYKNKYLELKGGLTLDSGKYAYFSKDITYLKQGSAPSVSEIDTKLSNKGYRVKYGTNKLELIYNEEAEKKKQGEYATLKKYGPTIIELDSIYDGSDNSVKEVKNKISSQTEIPINSYFDIEINRVGFNKVILVKTL
jgi:hypothetical protein